MRRWLLVLAAILPALLRSAAAADGIAATLTDLESSISAARVQAESLREGLASAPIVNEAADLVGIADGGTGTSLAALRLATQGIDRRLESLRRAISEDDLRQAELVLAMRGQLGTLAWALEEIPQHLAADAASRAALETALQRLDQALLQLAGATDTIAAYNRALPAPAATLPPARPREPPP